MGLWIKMEYTLIMIKPGFAREQMINAIKLSVKREGITIEYEYYKRFTEEQIRRAFYSAFVNEEEYVKYLSSDYMYVMLVSGNNCYQKMRIMKRHLRNQFGLDSSDMKNILHTADDGVEFYLQYSICEELQKFELASKGYANFFITEEKKLSYYEKKAFIVDSLNQVQQYFQKADYVGYVSEVELDDSIKVQVVDYFLKNDRCCIADSFRGVIYRTELLQEKLLGQLNDLCVRGIIMNNEKIEMEEADKIYDVMELFQPGWIMICGGNSISMGEESYLEFLNAIKKEDNRYSFSEHL